MYGSYEQSVLTNNQVISDTNWSDPDSIVQCNKELSAGVSYKDRLEKLACRNEAMLFGDHYSDWSKSRNRMEPNWGGAKDSWRSKLVYNDILVQIEHRLGMFHRQGRILSTRPATEDLKDRVVQRTSEQVLQGVWHTHDLSSVVTDWCQWAMTSAIAFATVTWNKQKGNRIRTTLQEWLAAANTIVDPAERQDFLVEQTMAWQKLFGDKQFYEGPEGDIDVEVCPIFEMTWWPFNAKNYDEVRVWRRRVRMSVDQAADRFGFTHEEIRQFGRRGLQAYQSRWGEMHWNKQGDVDDDGVFVDQVIKSPCWPNYPEGSESIVIGDTVVFGPGPIQSAMGLPPFIPLVEKKVRGNLHGTCTGDQLYSPQIDINTSMSQAADYRDSRVAPTMVNFKANESLNPNATVVPGEEYMVNDATMVPQVFKMPDVPVDFFRFAETDRMWMSHAGGTGASDSWSQDGGKQGSGRAINLQSQLTNIRLQAFGEDMDKAVGMLGCFILAEYQARAHTDRIKKFIGNDNTPEVVKFKGMDIRPSNYGKAGYDRGLVYCDAYSQIPKNPTELTNNISVMLENQILNPVTDRNAILDTMGMKSYRWLYDQTRIDTTKVEGLIRKWEQGVPCEQPDMVDNDEVHLRYIERWMKTEDYKIASQRFPMLGQMVNDRISQHKVNIVRKQLEVQYAGKLADASLWMEYKGRLQKNILTPSPMDTPETIASKMQIALLLDQALFALPITAMGGMMGPQGGSEQQGGSDPNKQDGPGRPKESSGPENQGVRKEEQNAGA